MLFPPPETSRSQRRKWKCNLSVALSLGRAAKVLRARCWAFALRFGRLKPDRLLRHPRSCGEAALSRGSQRDDEPRAADAGQDAGDLVGVLSVSDVRVCQPACAIACEREGCDPGVKRANVCRHPRRGGGDRDPELGGEVVQLAAGGMVVGVVEVAVGEFERRVAGGGWAGGRQGGRVRCDEDVGVGRDQLGELPRAVGCGEDELGGGRLAAVGVDDREVSGPAVPAAGEACEPYLCDVQAGGQRAAVACGRERLGCEGRQPLVRGVDRRGSGRTRVRLWPRPRAAERSARYVGCVSARRSRPPSPVPPRHGCACRSASWPVARRWMRSRARPGRRAAIASALWRSVVS